MTSRRLTSLAAVALLLVAGLSAPAVPSAAAPPKVPAEPLRRQIAIVVNGQQLDSDPAPRVVNGHVLIPIVRIFSALAITITRDGSELIAQAPNKTIHLTIGSSRARVDNQSLSLETAPVEIGGTTYVPLRLIADALGASVAYNPQSARIDIVSSLVRRENPSQNVGAGKTKVTGTLTALDLLSQPASMTVTYRGSVRTISINSTAKVVVQDVVARSEQNGQLSDLHVGDAVAVTLNKDGSVEVIQDLFGSRTGTVAAVSATAMVLENGRVITPDKTTEITLNGQPAKLGDLKVGDTVTQRMNPESGETRQIIASRNAVTTPGAPAPEAQAAPAASPVAITSFTVTPLRPLKLGEAFDLTLRGTPGGRASFDVGTFIVGQTLREESPGVYHGTLTVSPGMNFTQAAVVGRLSAGGTEAQRVPATNQISVATIAPQITEVAPANGQVVNNSKPSVYATFAAPTDLPINPSSVSLKINGSDVTASATRTSSFVTYTSGVSLGDGPVTVSVSVADLAGNVTARSWTFTIRTR